MINIGLAGFSQGYYAVHYLRYLARLKNVRVLGVCDCGQSAAYVKECAFVTAEDFSKELEVPFYRTYEELLAQPLDAVLICSETAEHTEMAAKALEKKIHIFVSKPLAFTQSDLKVLEDKITPNTTLLCGNPLKYETALLELREQVLAGAIGDVYSVRILVNHEAMIHQAWERDEKKSGGNLGTYATYLFDIPSWITGLSFQSFYAKAENFSTPEIDFPDTYKILGTMEGGTLAQIELFSGIRYPAPFLCLEVVGTKGHLITNYDNPGYSLHTKAHVLEGRFRTSDMGVGEMEHFLECIQKKTAPRCSFLDMIQVTGCVDAVRESLASQTEVFL